MMRMYETERLRLRPWSQTDLRFLAAILGDRDVMEFSDTGVLAEQAQAAWLNRTMAGGTSSVLPGMLAIERKRDGQVIGYISLSAPPDRFDEGDAEIGFRLARHAWSQGYASEAIERIIETAKSLESICRIIAIVDPHNARSLHALRKAGLTYERDIMFEGYDYPDHLYVRAL